jgi:uncharacterized protein (DUF58 family)
MKARFAPSRDVLFPLLLALVFLFTPFRVIRIFTAFLFLVQTVSFLQSRLAPRFVTVERGEEGPFHVHRFQKFTVRLKVRNLGPFPVGTLLVTESTGGLHTADPVCFLLSLAPYEDREFSYVAEAHERGDFHVGPVELKWEGALGFAHWRKTVEAPLDVVVYPAVFSMNLVQRRGLPAGNLKVANRLYEDVTQFRSLREYTPGDELRRIHWKASARMGRLYSMEYVPSLYFPVLIALDLTEEDYPLTRRRQLIERAVETAASLVFHFVAAKQQVGLIATGTVPGMGSPVSAGIRAGYGHAVSILEILARVRSTEGRDDFAQALVAAATGAPTGTRVLAVIPPLSEEKADALRGLRRRGRDVEAFVISSSAVREEDTMLRGLVSHSVDEYREEIIYG